MVTNVLAWGGFAGNDLAAGAIVGFNLFPSTDGAPGSDSLFGALPGSPRHKSPSRAGH
jgi:hypothetical protein